MIPDHLYGIPYDHYPLTEAERKNSTTVYLIGLLVSLAIYIPCLIADQLWDDSQSKVEHVINRTTPMPSRKPEHHPTFPGDVTHIDSPADELP
jgi:hypothetical protein